MGWEMVDPLGPAGNDELDSLIWHFLRDQDGHPTNNNQLIAAARSGWRRIDRRIQAMRKAGRIRFYRGPRGANPNRPAHVRSHGWGLRILQLCSTNGAPEALILPPDHEAPFWADLRQIAQHQACTIYEPRT